MKLTNKQQRALKFAGDAKRTGGQINGKTYKEWIAEAYPKTPELNKLRAIHDKSQLIGEFLDIFLNQTKGIHLCSFVGNSEETHNGGYCPCGQSITKLLAEFFGINEDKVEKERMQVLEFVRNQP